MKLLLDANLSWRLGKFLADEFDTILHVDNSGLDQPAQDVVIWDYAKQGNFTILTQDEDFVNLQTSRGFPPKILLLKTGNKTTSQIADIILSNKTVIVHSLESEDIGIVELYG